MKFKLKDWLNKDKVGTRFPKSSQLCPKCKQPTLEDTWPPNYCGGGTVFDGSNRQNISYGSKKFICLPCKISFVVSYSETTEYIDDGTFLGNRKTDRNLACSEPVALVERDGYLLTSHDVCREEYKQKHGDYPTDAYM